jgi:hypothetical protein
MIKSRELLIVSSLITLFGASLAPASHALDTHPQGQQTVTVPSRYVPNSIVTGVWQILDTQTGLLASMAAYHTEAEASVVASKINIDAWKSKKTNVPVKEGAIKADGKRSQDVGDTPAQKAPTTSIAGETVKEQLTSNSEDGARSAEPKRSGSLASTDKGNNSLQHKPKPR